MAFLLVGIISQNPIFLHDFALAEVTQPQTLTNNVLFVNFSGENDIREIEIYKDSYVTFDTLFNSGDYSVKNYYYINSNGHLNVNTPIYSDNNQDITVFTSSQPRSYYMPYVVNIDGKYQKNSNGYFEYMLVSAPNSLAQSVLNVPYSAQFFDYCTVIANVYVPQGNIGNDTNLQDKIISYNYAQTLANNYPNYYLIESPQRYLREFELLSEIMTKASNYIVTENSDKDSDQYFDVLSYAILDTESSSSYIVDWGSLLWAHKVSLGGLSSNFTRYNKTQQQMVSLMVQDGIDYQEAARQTQYLYNKPTIDGISFDTINISNYDISNLNSQYSWQSFVNDNSTFIHEFGHVLGLGDLYLGSSDDTPVGSWSQMCTNPYRSSFFTSYERKKLGWLDDDNIVEITKEGEYSLGYVKGLDYDNVVAYKITDPQKSSRSIYIEYRQTNGYFDSQCGQAGLLVYVADSDYDGNRNVDLNGKPLYEIYVQRNDGETVQNASINVGEKLDNIIFGKNNENIDSEIEIEVTFENNGEIIFTVKGGHLLKQDSYTLSDFDNNMLLYKKLLDNLPTGQSTLTKTCFVNTQYLDLNGIELHNLTFLSLFEMPNLQYLNLSNNELCADDLTLLEGYIKNLSMFKKAYLFGNDFTKNDIVNNSEFVFALVLDKNISEYLISLDTEFVLRQDDFIEIKINENTCSSSTKKQALNLSGGLYQISIKFIGTVAEHFNNTLNYAFNIVDVKSLYPRDTECYYIYIEQSLPPIEEMVKIFGADISLFKFDYSYPTLVYGNNHFDVVISYKNNILKTVSVYYYAFEKPLVTFLSGEVEYVDINSTFVDKGLEVYEEGEKTNYSFSNSNLPNTYYIQFIYLGGVFDKFNPILEDGKYVDNINTEVSGKYIICYSLTNKYNANFKYYRQVIVDETMDENLFDKKLYETLLSICGNNKLLKTTFSKFSSLDLSSYNLTSLNGLNALDFKPNCIIDVTNNNLQNINDLTKLCSTKDVIVYAMFNNFNQSDILKLDKSYSKQCVFGIQNLNTTILTTNDQYIVGKIYDDYNSFGISIDFPNATLNYNKNSITLNGAGQYTCKLSYNDKSLSKTISFVTITINSNQITKSYNQSLEIDSSIFMVEGTDDKNITFSNNQADFDLSIIGSYNLTIFVTYLDDTINLPLKVEVVDKIAPIISLNGEKIVYVNSLEMFLQNYANDLVTAYDDYDKVLSYEINGEVLEEYGIYELTYTTHDSSGNTAFLNRYIYIGNVSLINDEGYVELNEYLNLPLSFKIFNSQDFDIACTVNSESLTYPEQGFLFKDLGMKKINLKLTHKLNSSLQINLQYTAIVRDTISPQVKLIGDTNLNIYIDQPYVEYGIACQDNSVDGIVGIDNDKLFIDIKYYLYNGKTNSYDKVNNLDLSEANLYKIEYTVRDASNNTTKVSRNLSINYYPIKHIRINESNLFSNFKEGDIIKLNLEIADKDKTNPNPTVQWYVNDELYATTIGTEVEFCFKDKGQYNIIAYVGNVATQTVTINVFIKTNIENILLIVGIIAISIVVVGFVIYFIKIYRKKYYF